MPLKLFCLLACNGFLVWRAINRSATRSSIDRHNRGVKGRIFHMYANLFCRPGVTARHIVHMIVGTAGCEPEITEIMIAVIIVYLQPHVGKANIELEALENHINAVAFNLLQDAAAAFVASSRRRNCVSQSGVQGMRSSYAVASLLTNFFLSAPPVAAIAGFATLS